MPVIATPTTMVVRATGTAISRSRVAALAAVCAASLAGCGGSSQHGQFAWLKPGPAPAGWRSVSIADGATLAYPRDWQHAHGDPGTATAISYGADRHVDGYLNVTPRQGNESLSNWTTFRTEHNGDEGDRAVKRLAAATGLRFRSGQGSCVRDSYTTSSGSPYVELACIVRGSRATTVIVGAAPPDDWSRFSPQIEQAISAFQT
jgi:hypothetical protein